MFCPQCATKNLEGAHYCRTCGANISLVPQALSGQVPVQTQASEVVEKWGRRRRKKEEGGLDQSFRNVFMGIAFLLVAIALSNSIGRGWWFWMLIPAFSMMGSGIAQFIRLKEKEKRTGVTAPNMPRAFPDAPSPTPPNLSAPRTGELMPPVPSVTEGTTRHLGVEAPTRHLDPANDQK